MEYIVQPGDTLSVIARRFGITLQQLLAVNPQITDPNRIFPGQRINIPVDTTPPSFYIVQPGDTLYLIARRFGITLDQLLAANPQITDSNRIFPGQRINIPTGPPPSGTTFYVVQRGDTLFGIAQRFGTTISVLLSLNPGITNPNLIFPGQRILVPVSAVTPPGCIVYVSTRTGRPELWRSNARGEEQIQLTVRSGTEEQPVSNPQWSPNGMFIAYQAVGGVFIIDACGRRPRLLAQNVAGYSWSNDSTRIAYSNVAESPLLESTFIVTLEGAIRRVVENFKRPVWFRGDQRLAGFRTRENAFPILATVDITGENLREFDTPAAIVRLSPNGRYAATQLLSGSAFSVFSSVFVYDFVESAQAMLPGFEITEPSNREYNYSVLGGWSPDSTRLVYSTLTSIDGRGEIRIASPQGSILQSFERNFYAQPNWGPANDWIIYTLSERPGTSVLSSPSPKNIYVRNIATNQETRITSLGDNYSPDWNGVLCPSCR